MTTRKIGILGDGNVGGALARGLKRSGDTGFKLMHS
jgi:pyrroline-5-carboxylate reductase